jgi:P63C domain
MTTDILLYKNEFWTVVATGESATSLRGLSRLSGVPQKTVSRWFEFDLSHEGVPDELKPLADKPLYLSHEIKRRGKAVKPVLMDIVMEIVEYAAFDLGKPAARFTYKEFAKIGATSYAQGQTGWLPNEKQSSRSSRSALDAIISGVPKAWYLHFDPDWQREACRVTGNIWHPSYQMGRFISKAIYKVLPSEVYDRLMQVNGDRKQRHHQFFTEDADGIILKRHIQAVYGLLLLSKNEFDFWRHFKNAFGDGIQIDLDFEDAI